MNFYVMCAIAVLFSGRVGLLCLLAGLRFGPIAVAAVGQKMCLVIVTSQARFIETFGQEIGKCGFLEE